MGTHDIPGVEQRPARLAHNQEVAGSTPAPGTPDLSDVELHDPFELQSGRWRELLALTVEHAIIVQLIADLGRRYKRSLLANG